MRTINSIFKTFLVGLLLAAQVHFAYAQTAALLPVAPQQFFDKNGNPVTSGSVGYYIPGTSTPKMVWQDDSQTTPWTNPITLNAGGWPPNNKGIYGNGTYRQIIKDKYNNIISDQPTSATGSGGGSGTSVGDGNSVGTILAWSGMVAPNQYQFAYGQNLSRTTYPELLQATTLLSDITCVGGNATITGIADTSNIPVGAAAEANCIPAGSTVISKTISTVTLSIAANISTTTSARFFPYGNGNGSTTFTVVDMRGKVAPGRTNMGGVTASNLTSTYYGSSPDAVGANGGSQSKSLSVANLAQHNHGVFLNDPGHNHPIFGISTLNGNGTSISATTYFGPAQPANMGTTNNNTTGITVRSASGGGGTQNQTADTGSGTAFSLIQPSITLNYIIKVTPDTSVSGLFGVASIGGMQGVIACGTGLSCVGNIISATGGGGGGTPGGTNGQVQYNNSGSFGGFTASGDATINTATGAITVSKYNSGTTFGTAAAVNTGSSGHTIPYLDIANTWSALQTFSSGASTSALTMSAITGSVQCLQVNTSGVVSGTGSACGSGGGGGTPGGSNTQLQYNNGGVFGGITGATSNGTSVTLTGPTFAGTITLSGITGSTQCLQVNSSGVVSGSGSSCAAGGTVTSVSWTGGIVSVGTPTTTPAFTIAGTSGGIPYFSSASTWASSAALTAGEVVVGGGAGSAPSTSGARTITSNSSSALAVGPNGATNPGFRVEANAASAAAGVRVGGLAAGSGAFISSISSNVDENLNIDAKGAGAIIIGNASTGGIYAVKPLILGLSTNGNLIFTNTTSGSITLTPTTGALGTQTITIPATSGTLPVKIASGSTALATSAISSGTCASVITVAATGVLTTDVVNPGLNGNISAITGYTPATSGALRIDAYPTSNNVNFLVCNPTSSSITPGAVTLNWNVIR